MPRAALPLEVGSHTRGGLIPGLKAATTHAAVLVGSAFRRKLVPYTPDRHSRTATRVACTRTTASQVAAASGGWLVDASCRDLTPRTPRTEIAELRSPQRSLPSA